MTCREAVLLYCDGGADGCHETGPEDLEARTVSECREDARKQGWVVRANQDLCPVCKLAPGQQERLPG